MDQKLEELCAVAARLDAKEYALAANLIADICAYLNDDLGGTDWIEKKAIALSLGKGITEIEFEKQNGGWVHRE